MASAAAVIAGALREAVGTEAASNGDDHWVVNHSTQPSSSSAVTVLDLSHQFLDEIPAKYLAVQENSTRHTVEELILSHNSLASLPLPFFYAFTGLTSVDISTNLIETLPEELCALTSLRVLVCKENRLADDTSLPKSLHRLRNLEVLNLSGNRFEDIPAAVLTLPALRALYLGSNSLRVVSSTIGRLTSLEVLYLGGNKLREIPDSIGELFQLSALTLCDNRLEEIPSSISRLQSLKSLSLHKNQLQTLPREIVSLENLQELSLRGNPLVNRFVRDLNAFDALPSLKELAARAVKIERVAYTPYDLPSSVIEYLHTGHQCVNPKCKGVYFDARVEHVKFVDFCGKYRVPLLQYLCSPRCDELDPAYALTSSSTEDEPEDEQAPEGSIMRRVLLG